MIRFLMVAKTRGGVLYSDPHPGNFLMLPDGRVGVVDFGACGAPPAGFGAVEFDLGEALYNGELPDVDAALRRHGFVRSDNEFDVAELARIIAPFIDVLRVPEYRLTSEWLHAQIRVIAELRLSNVFRQMNFPPELVPVARCALTVFGVLCQLGVEGPIRAEVLLGSPELTDVLHRYDERRVGV